jgi:hypothetical protein
VPKYNLAQELTQPAPLDPERLYLSIYPAPEAAYRVEKRPEPFGTTVRPGSTSMWGGVRFLNGYSPIRPAGVARAFDFAIHGEINPEVAQWLLAGESGPSGLLERLGVDGIVVAHEVTGGPRPDSDWQTAADTAEGRVFHRAGLLPRVRSVDSIDSRPGEQFSQAAISRIVDGRNRLEADVAVPASGPPALLTISRPFFNGYRARLGDRSLGVTSYRGLMPVIEVPSGTKGRLTLEYRPWWLIWGGATAAASLAAFLGASLLAATRNRSA